MKKLIVLAVASLIATSANAAEMKWSGSAGWRYSQTKQDDGLNSKAGTNDTSKQTTKAHEARANLGVNGGWENVEWGAGVRTTKRGATATANDDFTTLQQNSDLSLGFEQAWFRYLRDFGSLDFSVTVGRQKNVMAYDSVSQNFFDNDVRWDGFGWQFKFGMFGLNAAQYILGGKSTGTNGASTYNSTAATAAGPFTTSKFNYLMAVQPHATWKFSDEIETMFAVGYYHWSDSSHTNNIGTGSATWNSIGTVAPIGSAAALNMHNARQWQFLATATLPFNLSFNGEYVMNKKTRVDVVNTAGTFTGTSANMREADRAAWSLGLTYGALKKANDFTIAYAYGNKGEGAVISNYSNESFSADKKGHRVTLGYSVADNFNLGWDAYFLKEKDKMSPVTGTAFTGTNANQELKFTYWELTAGVMF